MQLKSVYFASAKIIVVQLQMNFIGIHFLDMDHGWACTFGVYVLTLN